MFVVLAEKQLPSDDRHSFFRDGAFEERLRALSLRYPTQLPAHAEALIVSSNKDKPYLGARKIRELLVSQACRRRAQPLQKARCVKIDARQR